MPTSPLRGEVDAQRRVRGSDPQPAQMAKRAATPRARSLRANQTDAEQRLWSIVRNRQIDGYKFVRQFPVEPYFADFACREAALIIELDGGQHVESPSDEIRTAYLTGHGYCVLRFWNSDVLTNTHGVAESILAAVAGHPSPDLRFAPATLSPEGRGEKGTLAATSKHRSYRLTADIARLMKE